MNPKCKHCSAWNNQTGCQSENPCPISDEPAIKTNGDRFRAMSNEEMADRISINVICDFCPAETNTCKHRNGSKNVESCCSAWLEWLNSPAESER